MRHILSVCRNRPGRGVLGRAGRPYSWPVLARGIDRDDVGDARRAMALPRARMDARGRSRCGGARRYCSHGRASRSLALRADDRLEWTFAGHGGNRYLSSGETHARLTALLERDGEGTDARLYPLIRHAPTSLRRVTRHESHYANTP